MQAQHHAEIVCRHLDDLFEYEAVLLRLVDHLLQIAHAPARIARLEVGIEGLVARRRMAPIAALGPVEI